MTSGDLASRISLASARSTRATAGETIVTSSTFEIIADTIAEECAVPREAITLDSHIANDLGLDSIAFLDLCYALDVKLDIKIPFAEWVNAINSGKIDSREHFILRNLVTEIDNLVERRVPTSGS